MLIIYLFSFHFCVQPNSGVWGKWIHSLVLGSQGPANLSKHAHYLSFSEMKLAGTGWVFPSANAYHWFCFAFQVVPGKNEVMHFESAAYFVDFLSAWFLCESEFVFSFSGLTHTFMNLINPINWGHSYRSHKRC